MVSWFNWKLHNLRRVSYSGTYNSLILFWCHNSFICCWRILRSYMDGLKHNSYWPEWSPLAYVSLVQHGIQARKVSHRLWHGTKIYIRCDMLEWIREMYEYFVWSFASIWKGPGQMYIWMWYHTHIVSEMYELRCVVWVRWTRCIEVWGELRYTFV